MHFNKELLQVDEAEDQVILTTFQAGLLPRDFFFSITNCLPKIVPELLHKAYKYTNAEDAVTAKGVTTKRKQDEGTGHNPDRKKEARSIGHTINKKRNLLNRKSKFLNFSFLVMPIE